MVNRLHASAATAICQPILALARRLLCVYAFPCSYLNSFDGGNNQNELNPGDVLHWFKEEMRAGRTLLSAMQRTRIAMLPDTASSMKRLFAFILS
jgi:hypothetical protein